MEDNDIQSNYRDEEVAEIFSVQLKSGEIRQFIEDGKLLHKFFTGLEGYIGLEIMLLSEVMLIVLVRWKNYILFDKSLPLILNGCLIKKWFKNTVLISHQPAITKKYN